MLVFYISLRYIVIGVKAIREKTERKTVWLPLIAACLLAFYILQCFAWDFSRTWPEWSSYADLHRMDPLGYFFVIINVGGLFLMLDYRKHTNVEVNTEQKKEEPRQDKAQVITEKYGISKRERDVLELMLQGQDNQSIAETLFISPNTLRHHISSIYKKTGVSNRIELMMLDSTADESNGT